VYLRLLLQSYRMYANNPLLATMFIDLPSRVSAFAKLGNGLRNVYKALIGHSGLDTLSRAEHNLYRAALEAPDHNPWFTLKNTAEAIGALGEMLRSDKISEWVEHYPGLKNGLLRGPGKIAVIQAGNIPLVGFHDFVCVLMSGGSYLGKLSSQDQKLPVAAAGLLIEINEAFGKLIEFSEGPISGFDRIIATGSNNSARYFEFYFGKYPHIIRKNRHSVAILSGNESSVDLGRLGADVFSFYGLGCRNVSKLLVTEKFDPETICQSWADWKSVADHHKYHNNYDYFKAVYMINKILFTDAGFCLLREEKSTASPISVVHYEVFHSEAWLREYLDKEKDNLQCVMGTLSIPNHRILPFGTSQQPELWDYADGIDTIQFLLT